MVKDESPVRRMSETKDPVLEAIKRVLSVGDEELTDDEIKRVLGHLLGGVHSLERRMQALEEERLSVIQTTVTA